jgi:hypothetical protein
VKARSVIAAALALLVLLLPACSRQASSSSVTPAPTQTPAFSTRGVLPLASDGTLSLIGDYRGLHPKRPGVDEVQLAVPALADGILVPVRLTFAVDPQARVLDRAGNDIPAAGQNSYIGAHRTWRIAARLSGSRLIATQLESVPTSALASARAHPAVVIDGLFDFAGGAAPLRGLVTGAANQSATGRFAGASFEVPLRLDGVDGLAELSLFADRSSTVLDGQGAVLAPTKAGEYLGLLRPPNLQARATVRQHDHTGLVIATLQAPDPW